MLRYLYLICLTCVLHPLIHAQPFGKYEVLHGKLNPARTCIDVIHYDIALKVMPESKTIQGINEIMVLGKSASGVIQLDLDTRIQITRIEWQSVLVDYKRDSSVVWVLLPEKIKKGNTYSLRVHFEGKPKSAVRAPWDGGFVWKTDDKGRPFIGLACEGIGASVWLPCKDHWSDEPDSMHMHLTVPEGLVGVSNGRLYQTDQPRDGFQTYHWHVSNPINLYGITVNIAAYTRLNDMYTSLFNHTHSPLELTYYVLDYNREQARMHFRQVQPMLRCFEQYLGAYPFWNDSYKLVESPYWGMEHQSCVAYGNNYANNRYDFDFIIVHESAHEWFANAITADDPADMWIHESFTTYAEALYVECMSGKEIALQYLKEQKIEIKNKAPLQGPRDVFFHNRSDNDIYYKGTWVLHVMRHTLNNDSLFTGMLKAMVAEFGKKTTHTAALIKWMNQYTGKNWNAFFNQYVYTAWLPEIEYKIVKVKDGKLVMKYRLAKAVKGFELPIEVKTTKVSWDFITPTSAWQLIDLNYFDESEFSFRTDFSLYKITRIK